MSSSSLSLPKLIVIKSNIHPDLGHVYYSKGSPVLIGEPSVFSTLVKIEVEQAKTDDKYINLRFCSSNKYWQKNDDDSIVAVSNKVEEDTTKPSCTLFEAVRDSEEEFHLIHVQSGNRVLLNGVTKGFYVEDNKINDTGNLAFKDWSTFVNLPPHVAFRGNNSRYLQAHWDDHCYLKFKGDDANDPLSAHTITPLPDGHLLISCDHWQQYWRRSPNWIWADEKYATMANDILYWPVLIDNTTVALRNKGNSKFCKRLTTDGMESCLNADASSLENTAIMTVKELVRDRKIYNVRYRMEDARIYGETPFLAGSTTVTNEGDTEATMTASISYEKSQSSTFSNSSSITAGLSNTIEAGVPEITKESITISVETTIVAEWGTTTTTTTASTGTAEVTVPPRSEVTVTYVATEGICDVPFSYTQQDTNSVDGTIYRNDKIDGVYTGVNQYKFNFDIGEARPLG